MLIGMEVSEDFGHCRLAEAKSRGNSASGIAIEGQREDIFLLSRGGGMHWRIVKSWQC